ncbi:MAG TPA: DNA mismatch repair protein MutS [Bacillota bacterium]|nr:DNA mismatch repair protein MutS [Bacillota bacterium]
MIDSKSEYKGRIEDLGSTLKNQKKKLNVFSNLRLFVFLLGFASGIYLYFSSEGYISYIVMAITLAVFIPLVMLHSRLKADKKKTQLLLRINEDSIKRTTGEWKDFKDGGEDFVDYEHAFTGDLDIFGRTSLFKWINTGLTYKGRRLLADWLKAPCDDIDEINKRQGAAKELAGRIDFRQEYQMAALLEEGRFTDPQPLFEWATKANDFYRGKTLIGIVSILPIITIASLLAAFAGLISYLVPVLFLVLQIGLMSLKYIDTNKIIGHIEPSIKSIGRYGKMLQAFEDESFTSDYLIQLQGQVAKTSEKAAYLHMRGLEKIMNRLMWRYSGLYLVVNILLLWDYKCIIGLEKWKRESGSHLEQWISVLSELEALNSIAILYCDHPDWTTPILKGNKEDGDEETGIAARQMGHPLLGGDRVCNDLQMKGKGRVYLITGSNMSGKSTLLRTVGINLVLAYAGAPVCAEAFSLSMFKIYSSMRIRDDLDKNISSFYAELLRIKTIIEAAKGGDQVIFLLDEIFKGTNSRDRHTGASILIKQLSSEGAVGFVSTHDVELGALADENSKIENYHFKENYKKGQLYFDYKLHPGISNTRNAIYLMEMAGVTVAEQKHPL